MSPEQIDASLAEVAKALEQDASAPLLESQLRELQRTLGPASTLLERRWQDLRVGGPIRTRESAAGRGAAAEAQAEQVRQQREQLAAQIETISQRRRLARRREGLANLPGAYLATAQAVNAAETALAAAIAALDAIDAAATQVVQCRVAAADSCPDAPPEAEELPRRVAALAKSLGDRSAGIVRWPGNFADRLGIEASGSDQRLKLAFC